MDGDTTEEERLKQEGLGDSGHLSNFLPWGQRVSRNLVDKLRGKAERYQRMAVVWRGEGKSER